VPSDGAEQRIDSPARGGAMSHLPHLTHSFQSFARATEDIQLKAHDF
jgi:hypothetical protein